MWDIITKWLSRNARKIALRAIIIVALGTLLYASPIAGIAVLVMLAVVMLALFFFLPWLAEEDILTTKVKEGTGKAIMRGNSFDRFVMSFEGYHLNDPKAPWFDPAVTPWERIWHGKEHDREFDKRSWLLRYLGLYWVGMPWANSVRKYHFEWNETKTDQDGKKVIWARDAQTDFVYVSEFPYAVVADKAETQDLLQVDVLSIIGVRVWNPYLAEFNSEDWMTRITAAILRQSRNYVGGKKYAELKTDNAGTDFSGPVINLNANLPDDVDGQPKGLRGRYGIEITTADIQDVELAGSEKENVQKSAAKAFTAAQDALAVTTAADAQAHAIKVVGNADAEALTARLNALKGREEVGVKLASFDAIKEASKGAGSTQTIWANNALEAAVSLIHVPDSAKKGDSK